VGDLLAQLLGFFLLSAVEILRLLRGHVEVIVYVIGHGCAFPELRVAGFSIREG
jgi:hypothetical protein